MTSWFCRLSIFLTLTFLYLTSFGGSQTAFAQANSAPEEGSTTTPKPAALINPTDTFVWSICNETSFMLRLAHATLRDGSVKAKGWKELQPGQCLDEKIPKNAPRLLYAESLKLHRGGIREWKGNIPLCVGEDDFLSDAKQNCKNEGLQSRKYFAIKPGEQTTTLIEPSDYGKKAQVAGTQRLLRDAGYKITSIDGLPGRRTSRSIDDFIKAEGLTEIPDGKELLARLAKVAAASIDKVGFEICNNSSTEIYAAISLQQNGNWSSKGWWAIQTDQCVRPITQPLIGLDAHYYALKEAKTAEDGTKPEDLRLRSVAAIPAQFCIAEAQFSALGRDYCFEEGYSVANFRPLPADKDSTSVSLNDEDFAPPAPQGLRR